MSAIEQPAAMSGNTTVTRLAVALGEFLRSIRQDIRRLCHEVNAAKNDGFAITAVGRHLAELIAVSRQIREFDHFVLLIVMSENQQLITLCSRDQLDPRFQFAFVERLVWCNFKTEGQVL